MIGVNRGANLEDTGTEVKCNQINETRTLDWHILCINAKNGQRFQGC